MSELQTKIPLGSWVLVTGATGHIASHVVRLLLTRGFKVRGTVRDLASAAWLTRGPFFEPFHNRGDLQLFHVPDMSVPDAFAEAIKGMSAIAHIASILHFAEDPDLVIPPVVNSLVSILEAANREPSVKRIVYTSSIAAAVNIKAGAPSVHVGRESWNEDAVRVAEGKPPHPADYGHLIYQASKVKAEQALWEFMRRQEPSFDVNVVSPSTVLGRVLDRKHLMSPYPWVRNLWEGKREVGELFQAVIHIDVEDVALLHVATILDPECSGARLQAWNENCNMNDILAVLRKSHPERGIMTDFANQTQLDLSADFEEPLALLRKWGGQNGWTSLQQSVNNELDGVLHYFPDVDNLELSG